MDRKKILIFSLMYYPRFVGGAEIAIGEVTKRIDPKLYEFHLITLGLDSSFPKQEKIGNVHVYRIGQTREDMTAAELRRPLWYLVKMLYPVVALFRAIELHRKIKFDFTWAIMTYMSLPALLFKWLKGVPYVITLQDGDSPEHITGRKRIFLLRPFLRAAFRGASDIQCISNYLSGFAKKMGSKIEPKVIPNGVDTRVFKRDPTTVLKQELHLGGSKIIITTSRIVQKNGIDILIESLVYLPKDIKLLIVGQGELREKLEALVLERALSGRVVFLGHVPYEMIPLYLSLADVFARPSRSEGMGSSFIEAMAVGIPVIGTAVGGIVDFLRHRETGLIVPVNNPRALAESISLVLNDEKLCKKLVEHAQDMIQRNYAWDRVADSIKKMFDGVRFL